jgi:hypothetical protein
VLYSAALLVVIFILLISFRKEKNIQAVNWKEIVNQDGRDRLLSVANVYYTEDGKKAEAWFYETPIVYEFSADGPNAKRNFELLKNAKEKKEPVNVRPAEKNENLIDVITPATAGQLKNFRDIISKLLFTTEVPAPAIPDSLRRINRKINIPAGVVPNLATLNNIFNTVKSQCCKLPGVLLYGQCIPFQFVADGCYARAHKMRQVIENHFGYTSYKVFNYACNGAGTLSVKATLWGNNCCVKWWYHVASYVIVQVGGNQYGYLIDPAMFTGPVSIPTWVAAQKNTGCGYGGAAQGQVYYSSNAYVPSTLDDITCKLIPSADNNYTAANATCAAYSVKQGCSF